VAAAELDRVLAALAGGQGGAAATVVAVAGSAYRRPGARAAYPAGGGGPVGTLAGGCVDADVAACAAEVASAGGRPRLVQLDLAAGDGDWGWGAGCPGALEVFVEPAGPLAAVAAEVAAARAGGRRLVLATGLAGPALGRHLLVGPGGERQGSLGDAGLEAQAAAAGARAPAAAAVTVGGHRLFVEPFDPPPRLVVCGAGPDAEPLVGAGAALGWRVEVVDHGPARLDPARFPGAARLVAARPEAAAAAVGRWRPTAVVVMSHHLERDGAYLASFLASGEPPPAYLAVLGPRPRAARLAARLGPVAGGLRAPAGLDLGAETPEEVALSIAAEALAALRGAGGGPLCGGHGPVHRRTPAAGAAQRPAM